MFRALEAALHARTLSALVGLVQDGLPLKPAGACSFAAEGARRATGRRSAILQPAEAGLLNGAAYPVAGSLRLRPPGTGSAPSTARAGGRASIAAATAGAATGFWSGTMPRIVCVCLSHWPVTRLRRAGPRTDRGPARGGGRGPGGLRLLALDPGRVPSA
ncbi:hypothetical protein [Methylobacterium sp. WL1]|uniref:hypothetical protein n=1 Tax=Methylobacterium sp. WL1 TaxID=2603276 RepID=UPI001FEFED26|nr:hypothetical protein [Methylobacterium sp. WL1]